MELQTQLLESNLQFLDKESQEKILNSEEGNLSLTKSGQLNLQIGTIHFHSQHDPLKEAERLLSSLKQDSQEKLYIFFGAGLGYLIQIALLNPKLTIVWMECSASILKSALKIFDYSNFLQSKRLRIILKPFTEDKLFTNFKGLSKLPTSFIPHRPSLAYLPEEYMECKFICEKFFQKKDVNIATLSRFEKIWTRNILQNIPELSQMYPVSLLFGIAKNIPIMVAGAGPSLHDDISKLKKYRKLFLLIAVDTSLHVLSHHGIEPDLIYSVDPQPINRSYLEGYTGKGILVFDPTSTFHSLRLDPKLNRGFFTSSPFPLFQIFSDFLNVEAGDIPFGGSVSTNAVSLAELMGASEVLFVGQDLAFTEGLAHCKGAILEERLNYKESRLFRREIHNYKQLNALTKIPIKAKNGKEYITNEKMQIFRKWFEDRASQKNWINLTSGGGVISGIPDKSFEEYFSLKENVAERVQMVQENIRSIFLHKQKFFFVKKFMDFTEEIIQNLGEFRILLKEGKETSDRMYQLALKNQEGSREFSELLDRMNQIDELVSSKKGLNEIIGLGVQRIILMITEGYDSILTLEEKKRDSLAITRKSYLLYEGLHSATEMIQKLIKKTRFRMKFYSQSP
jgi:hypothetical protein